MVIDVSWSGGELEVLLFASGFAGVRADKKVKNLCKCGRRRCSCMSRLLAMLLNVAQLKHADLSCR